MSAKFESDRLVGSSCCDEEPQKTSLVETIRAMRERETEYSVADYLHQPHLLACNQLVDMTCRSQMIEWMAQTMDHCRFSRSTVSSAVNMMDRFLMTTDWALTDRSAFQLVSITCLYLSIKINEPTVLSVQSIVALTKGRYRAEQIEVMERLILDTNKWLMNTPTPYRFGELLCEYIALKYSEIELALLRNLTFVQLDATLTDYELGLVSASYVALAAAMNSIDSIAENPAQIQQEVEFELKCMLQMDPSRALNDIQIRLYEGVFNADAIPLSGKSAPGCGSPHQTIHSPRSVSNLKVIS